MLLLQILLTKIFPVSTSQTWTFLSHPQLTNLQVISTCSVETSTTCIYTRGFFSICRSYIYIYNFKINHLKWKYTCNQHIPTIDSAEFEKLIFISYGLNKKEDKRGRHVDDQILRLYSLSLSLSPSTVVIDASLWDRPFMTPCVVVL